jgi:hypothetical protein
MRLKFCREAVLDEKTLAKMRKEEEKMKKDAEEMITRELKVANAASNSLKPSAYVATSSVYGCAHFSSVILHLNSGLRSTPHRR